MDLSIVIPAYNEAESLTELISWIDRVVRANNLETEVLVVDDGSTDNTWAKLKELSAEYPILKAAQLNRNYGKSAALQTGFTLVKGHVVITMDSDLQDSPDEIPELYKMIATDGFDMVSGWKQKRFDPLSKTIPSKLFNRVTQWMSGIKLNDFNCGLKAYRLKLVKSIDLYGEMHRYIPVIAKWNGFYKIGEKVVEHRARKYGVTKFGLERFIFGFLDLLSIMFVSRFKKRPMHFFGSIGTLSVLFGFAVSLYLIANKVYHSFLNVPVREVTAQPLFYLALTAIIVGSQMFLSGFVAEMITQSNAKKNEYLISAFINAEAEKV
jgi:glycosyltransferase involved in cell wall biosynthesis